MQVADEQELDQPRRDLSGPEQGADRHHGGGIEAEPLEHGEQVRRQAGGHERIGGKRGGDEDEGEPLRRQGAGRLRGVLSLRRAGLGARARQREGMQWSRHEGEQSGVDQVGRAPADRADQQMSDRPAHRRGEAARKRQRGDRMARARAEDASQRGEGRIIEGGRHGGPEHHPHREVGERVIGMDQRDEAAGTDQRSERHHAVAA